MHLGEERSTRPRRVCCPRAQNIYCAEFHEQYWKESLINFEKARLSARIPPCRNQKMGAHDRFVPVAVRSVIELSDLANFALLLCHLQNSFERDIGRRLAHHDLEIARDDPPLHIDIKQLKVLWS
jgi:hypothetical protein